MKKYLLSLIVLIATMSINAQVIKIYKKGQTTPVKTYTNSETEKYKIVFEGKPKFLRGNFSVSANKKVLFTRSNVYWNGSAFRFEDNPTDFPESWKDNHVGHFFLAQTAAAGYAQTYVEETITSDYVPFFAESAGGLTVENASGLYALSKEEWYYLLKQRPYTNRYVMAKVNGVNGLLIFPDNYNGNVKVSGTGISSAEYDIDMYFPEESIPSQTWTAMESEGVVFLPVANHREGTDFTQDVGQAYYWTSTTNGEEGYAHSLNFFSTYVDPESETNPYKGSSLRLVKGITPSTTYVTSVSLNKTVLYLLRGTSETLTADIVPSNAYNKKTTWTSSNTDVATVDATGKVSVSSTAAIGATSTITATTVDGNKTATCTVVVCKEPTLNGSFTVSASKTVQFTRSNVYWDGSDFRFEENQTDCPDSWNANHVGHFFWSKTAAVSYAKTYSDDTRLTSDVPFFAESAGGLTVEATSGFYALSSAEWIYLLNTRNYTNRYALAKVNGVNGLLIFPDSYNGTAEVTGTGIAAVNKVFVSFPGESIPSDTWTAMESAGVVFLPAAYHRDGSTFEVSNDGYYWSSTCPEDEVGTAFALNFFSQSVAPESDANRYYGCSLRLVKSNSSTIIPVASVSLNKTATSILQEASETLIATILPEDAYNKDIKWSSSNENVATVDATGKVSVLSTAAEGATAIITATTMDGGKTATCKVTALKAHEYVDLGLESGTLWATCNIGSDKPEVYGDYFAWAVPETHYTGDPQAESPTWKKQSKDYNYTGYNWWNYRWAKGRDLMTRYCTNAEEGFESFMDNKTEIEAEDDAATAIWGSEWQIPSKDQFDELLDKENTNAEWTTLNGINGYKITSKINGNSIFLPASGFRYALDMSLCSLGEGGYYWSRTLSTDSSFDAYYMKTSDAKVDITRRFYGQSIRPVRVQTKK